jgi:predicted nucleic acid-binding protein
MRRIYWDTMIHAYWFEDHKKLSDRVQNIYQTMQTRNDTLCSSPFVLGELLVGPLRTSNFTAAELIQQFFYSEIITMLAYPPRASYVFAQLRAQGGVKALDALHLAVAATAGIDLFLTNDKRLQKLAVPGIQFIASLDTDLF